MPSLSSPDQAEPEIATTDLVGRVIVRLATPISYLVWVLQLFSDYEPADEWRRDAVNVTTVHELRTALVARMQFCIVLIIYPVVLGIAIGALIGWISSLGEDGWLTILALALPAPIFFSCLGLVYGVKYELAKVSTRHMEQALARIARGSQVGLTRRLRFAMPNNYDLAVASLLTAVLVAVLVAPG
jgi:hypothetical protein